MVKSSAVLIASASAVVAWPALMHMDGALQGRDLEKRFVEPPPRAPQGKLNRPNTGLPPSGFNAQDQYVDVSPGSAHEFRPPGPTDIRGQCPGLNAAANHGFLSRSGITTITEGTTHEPITSTKISR